MEFLSKLSQKIALKKLKVTILTVFLLLLRVACWGHLGLKAHGHIYWQIIKSYSSKHPINCPCHHVTVVTATSSCCVAWRGWCVVGSCRAWVDIRRCVFKGLWL